MSITATHITADVTAVLAEHVAEADRHQVSTAALEAARDAVIDTLGVALAGSRDEAARIAFDLVQRHSSDTGATVIGAAFRAAPTEAALVNGVSAHALDFDDVNSRLSGHPSSVLVPALLALAEEVGASGRDLLEAYVVGFEIAARLGRALNPEHYRRGWHATATLGSPAAAAAAARLLKLDVDRTRAAIAIAASLAGGLRTSFGSMVKPLHAGNAARNGVLATLLAARGFSGAKDILEAPRGFGEIFGAGPDWSTIADGWDWQRPEILRSGIYVKAYPSCAMTHTAIDAMLELRPEIVAAEVEAIECVVDGLAPEVLTHHQPRTGLEGKFSMEYCLAVTLLDGQPGVLQFDDRRVARDDVQQLLRRVALRVEPTWPTDHGDGRYRARVAVRPRDGRTVSAERDYPSGSPERPMSRQSLEAKFLSCAAPTLGEQRATTVLAALDGLAECERVSDVARLLAHP